MRAWWLPALLLLTACEQPVARNPQPGDTVVMDDGSKRKVAATGKHPLYLIVETQPRNDYERGLELMLSRVVNVDALQQFCGQWYPDYGHDVADAYMAWRKKHEVTIKELMARSEAVWAEYSLGDTEYVVMVYPHLRKQMRKAIDAEFDRSPPEKFRQVCSKLPADLGTQWDLDRRYKKELALLRQTPITGG
jgi:hypothetical protein